MTIRKHTDVVIVGSGPGGATVARQLALSSGGLGITLLERGKEWRHNPLYGTYAGAMAYTDKASFLRTSDGLTIIRPLMLGGATSMFCGCSARPHAWWRQEYGIELDAIADQVYRELDIRPLPQEYRGRASTRIAESATNLGMKWFPQEKFVWPDRTRSFNCRATCMLGCRCGAKWNAAEFVDVAVENGLDLWTGAYVSHVIHTSGKAQGVIGKVNGKDFIIEARRIILAAGGLGSPMILRRSGFKEAGLGIALDTTTIVYGESTYPGNGNEPPMTWSHSDSDLGAMLSTLVDPWLNYPLAMIAKGPRALASWKHWNNSLGVMIKLKDEVSGHLEDDGQIIKGLTAGDSVRQKEAEVKARKILVGAGCDPDSIIIRPRIGTHPSATVRIDTMLSRNLETEIEGLYVCDASVFPQALGTPTVLTIICLARRLSSYLLQGMN